MRRLLLPILLLAVILGSCSNTPTADAGGLLTGRWILSGQTVGLEGEFDLAECDIRFDASGTLDGRDPCNGLFGNYTATSSTISMLVGGTKVGCAGADFREHLNAAFRYGFRSTNMGTMLELQTPNGILTFRRG